MSLVEAEAAKSGSQRRFALTFVSVPRLGEGIE
jgi:hypothetical protein